MFFHTFLLEPQHKMQLNLSWIAATLGVKKIKKNDLIKCNVVKVCDQILIFIRSDSLNPQKRFSLRLSSILITGLCKILRQQVIYLRDEIDRSLVDRERTADRLLIALDEDAESPPTPKPKIRKKKVKQPQQEQTPDSLIERISPVVPRGRKGTATEPEFTLEPLRLPDILGEEAIIQLRVDEITLREEFPGHKEPQLIDDFGPIEEIPVQAIPSTSAVIDTITVDIPPAAPKSPKSPRGKKRSPRLEEDAAPSVEVPTEKVVNQEGIEQDVPQIQVEEMQETMAPPPEKEPVIQVVPEIETIPVPQPEKEANKEEAVKKDSIKDKRASPAQKKKHSDITQLRVVEPEVEPRAPARNVRDKISFLLLKKRKTKYAFINQAEKVFKDEPNFSPNIKTIPDFKPMLEFWPDWENMQWEADVARPLRDTVSVRGSGATLGLDVDKSAGTPQLSEASLALMQQIETPSDVATPGERYVSTPRKRPLHRDETVEEILPPAANGEMGPPDMVPRKRIKVVSIEEVEATEMKEHGPELLIPQEQLEVPPIITAEVPEIPPQEEQRLVEETRPTVVEDERIKIVGKEKSPEKRVGEDVEERVVSPRVDYQQVDFGVKWSREIMDVIYQHDQITALEICRGLNRRVTKQNMSIIFATLLTLAKDQYVLLYNAEDSCELEYIRRGSNEFTL